VHRPVKLAFGVALVQPLMFGVGQGTLDVEEMRKGGIGSVGALGTVTVGRLSVGLRNGGLVSVRPVLC